MADLDSSTKGDFFVRHILNYTGEYDYSRWKYSFEELRTFYSWSTVFTMTGSALSVFLNVFLIISLLVVEELRKMIFFPIALQAFMDVLGPGISNVIHVIWSQGLLWYIENSPSDYDYLYKTELSYLYEFAASTTVNGIFTCVLIFFKSILNETSTGFCITASAFIRYCMICHPAKDLLTSTQLKGLSTTIVLLILVSLVFNGLAFMFIFEPFDYAYSDYRTGTKAKKFVLQCSRYNFSLNYPLWRMTVYLIMPALLSAFFYFKICRVLLNCKRNEERNRNLTLAFLANWLLWVVLWTPYYFLTYLSLQFDHKRVGVHENNLRYALLTRLILIRENI